MITIFKTSITGSIARLLITSLLLANTITVRAWDCGPPQCKQGFCNGGIYRMGPDSVPWRGNTHAFIVVNALGLLKADSQSQNLSADKVFRLLNNNATCRQELLDGLWSADDPPYSEPSRPGSHFYNAARKDWRGLTTDVVTYRKPALIGRTNSDTNLTEIASGYGDAKTNAISHLPGGREWTAGLTQQGAKIASPCFQIGLALHYVTDLTQPMHTSSFSVLQTPDSQLPSISGPNWIHATYEAYVPILHEYIENNIGNNTDHSLLWSGWSKEQIIDEIAKKSNNSAKSLIEAITSSPGNCNYKTNEIDPGAIFGIDSVIAFSYTGPCFRDSEVLKQKTSELVMNAIQSTASFLVALAPLLNENVFNRPVATLGDYVKPGDSFRLKGEDGKYISSGTIFENYWYPTYGRSTQRHTFEIVDSIDPQSGRATLKTGHIIKLSTLNPDTRYPAYKNLMAPKSGNAAYYSYNTGEYEKWVVFKYQRTAVVNDPIRFGDKIVLINRFWKSQSYYLYPYDQWLGIRGPEYAWVIEK